ncbi:hypothetical protein ACFPT7_14365 [Acidicapsa dinghuensis]|uniref:Uncharacterized protein n=1 Tax=Acidicapsa dinghuensis TaxID=2218256 RepID=A0ABW1EGT6_9BACT|nr:hypothetical protein [Acidicapsa dinghuensis]
MDNRMFAEMVKREAVDPTVGDILKTLKNPRSSRPVPAGNSQDPISTDLDKWLNDAVLAKQRRAAWFVQLDEEGQQTLKELLQECAEATAFHFLNLIDGTGGSFEGVFEIVAVDGDESRTIINPENTDMLHDLFSEVCEANRERAKE